MPPERYGESVLFKWLPVVEGSPPASRNNGPLADIASAEVKRSSFIRLALPIVQRLNGQSLPARQSTDRSNSWVGGNP
jgi:hypothetical protein